MSQSQPLDDLLKQTRSEYALGSLSRVDLDSDPINQLRNWLEIPMRSSKQESNAVALATATTDGTPSVRMVLLRGLSFQGLDFYSNYESQKGKELAANPHGTMLFSWMTADRQVRVSGKVVRLSAAESDKYFRSRPKNAQIGAWASRQSQVIPNRKYLIDRYEQFKKDFAEDLTPRPPYWGGYRLVPDTFEFWQGRPNRLHDRFRYTKAGDDTWLIDRLAP